MPVPVLNRARWAISDPRSQVIDFLAVHRCRPVLLPVRGAPPRLGRLAALNSCATGRRPFDRLPAADFLPRSRDRATARTSSQGRALPPTP